MAKVHEAKAGEFRVEYPIVEGRRSIDGVEADYSVDNKPVSRDFYMAMLATKQYEYLRKINDSLAKNS